MEKLVKYIINFANDFSFSNLDIIKKFDFFDNLKDASIDVSTYDNSRVVIDKEKEIQKLKKQISIRKE